MNRQQRRIAARQARAKAERRATLDAEQDFIREQIDNDYLEQAYTMVGIALMELYGFGEQQIGQTFNRMNEIWNGIQGDTDKLHRLQKKLSDETGVYIDWTRR